MKRLIKLFTFLVPLFVSLLCISGTQTDAADLSSKNTMALLESIENYAMVYGEGEKKIYVFVDPKCPHSQDFISMINDNAKMRTMYRYYIFFYELKRFNSHNLIAAIYGSAAPLQRTLEVMVGGKEMQTSNQIEPKIETKIGDIARVADEIGVSKRPYLIIAKKWD